MAHWYRTFKALVESAEEHFIRFGDIPEGERSKIGGISASSNVYEDGVSCYYTSWSVEHEAWELEDVGNMASVDELIAQKRPAYLVTGEVIGQGTDDEPLLHNVTIIKKIPYTEIFIPAWGEYAEEEDYRVEYPAKDDEPFIRLHTTGASRERAFGFFNDLYRSGFYVMWGNNDEIFMNKRQFDMKKVSKELKVLIDRYENNSAFRVVPDIVLPHSQIRETEPAGFMLYKYYDLKDQ